mmetsp:Transcript_25600/g.40259  ORF Transcript_25600/g.40259 Transcript_25600/m.40259 type:complete len:232 (+) Transcript_25600:48-743(+)
MAWRPDDKINEYGEPTYWDQHYDKKRKEEGLEYSFDFYVEPESLMPLLESYFGTDKGMNLLIIGAGSSEIPQLLYEAGFRRITCIDVSPVLVAHMQNRHHQHEGLDYFVMDVKNLGSFPDNSFDGILDKGTMDALFGSIRCMDDVLLMSKEVCRVLKVGKTFVEVSHGLPDTRLIYLRHHSLQWTAQHFTLPAPAGGGDAEAAATRRRPPSWTPRAPGGGWAAWTWAWCAT